MSMPSSSEDVATRHGIRPAFSCSSIVHALLARERAVVRAGDLLLGELVEPQREPLGEAAVVDEDDRRAVRSHELEQRRVDRRPDRRAPRSVPASNSPVGRTGCETRRQPARACPRAGRRPRGRAPSRRRRRRARSGGRPRRSGRSPRAVAASPRGRCAGAAVAEHARAARPRARGARRASCPATACTSSTISVSTRAQQLARLRGEQQEERLGRRDQDVGRPSRASPRAPSAACRRCGRRRRSCDCEPGERAAEVALDVVVERLQRRDVEHAQALRPASASAGRSRRGRRRASCPSRSAPGSAVARRRRSPASPCSCAGVGASKCARTRPASPGRRRPAARVRPPGVRMTSADSPRPGEPADLSWHVEPRDGGDDAAERVAAVPARPCDGPLAASARRSLAPATLGLGRDRRRRPARRPRRGGGPMRPSSRRSCSGRRRCTS